MNKEQEQELARQIFRRDKVIEHLRWEVKYCERKASILGGLGIAIRYLPSIIPWFIWFWVVLAMIGVGLWVVRSHYEAKTYNEITGKNITTQQALWVQLRVMEPAMNGGPDEQED